jgi:hypothetical protein
MSFKRACLVRSRMAPRSSAPMASGLLGREHVRPVQANYCCHGSSPSDALIMRYELTDYEWAAVRPFLRNKSRGVPRVNDRRVLNGIFWVLRSGAPWRDLPESFGPYTTC